MKKFTKKTAEALLKQRRINNSANKKHRVVQKAERANKRFKKVQKTKNKNPKKESPIISKNSHFLRFLCLEASTPQQEEILFEIEPGQLSAVRELISNLSSHKKELAQEYSDESLTSKKSNARGRKTSQSNAKAKKCRQNVEIFMKKLLDQKATRFQLRKNAKMLTFALRKALKMYDGRDGVTSSSTFDKKRTLSSELGRLSLTKKQAQNDQSLEQSSEESEMEEGEISSERENEQKEKYDEEQSHSSSSEEEEGEDEEDEEEEGDEEQQERNESDNSDHDNIDEEETNAFEDSESEDEENE